MRRLKKVFVLEWPDDLGEFWLNDGNLKILLASGTPVKIGVSELSLRKCPYRYPGPCDHQKDGQGYCLGFAKCEVYDRYGGKQK